MERSGVLEVFSSASGEWIQDLNTLPELQRRLCYEPIKFDSMVKAMRGRGMNTFIEIGRGQALGGFAQAIDNGVRVLAAEDAKSFGKAVKLAH